MRVQSTDKVFFRKARRTREETESLYTEAGGDLGGDVDLREQ